MQGSTELWWQKNVLKSAIFWCDMPSKIGILLYREFVWYIIGKVFMYNYSFSGTYARFSDSRSKNWAWRRIYWSDSYWACKRVRLGKLNSLQLIRISFIIRWNLRYILGVWLFIAGFLSGLWIATLTCGAEIRHGFYVKLQRDAIEYDLRRWFIYAWIC